MEEKNLSRSDHDTLIRLETKFDTFSTQVISDIKDLKEGTQAKLNEHETRITLVEKIHSQTQPLESMKKLNDLIEWKSNQESNRKLLVVISSFIGSVIGFTLSILSVIFHILHI